MNLFSSISSVEPSKDQNFISDDSFQLKSRERLNEMVIEIQSHRKVEIIEDRRVFLIQPDDKIDFIMEAQLWSALSISDPITLKNLTEFYQNVIEAKRRERAI